MSDPSGSVPPPSGGPPSRAPGGGQRREIALEPPAGGLKRLLGRRGPMRLTLSPAEIAVEHAQFLRAPLRFAPGAVALATIDRGPAQVPKDPPFGRFPVLHRLVSGTVVPREEGIEGWLWTSSGGSAMAALTGDDAPNVALLFSRPLSGPAVDDAFEPAILGDIAKRSPLGQPTIYGLLLRAANLDDARLGLEWLSLMGTLTDRDVPPTQRRHLPDDKPANPEAAGTERVGGETSIPPPGMG